MEKRPITFTLFFLRLLSGIGGGIAGTLMAFVVYFLLAPIIPTGDDSSLSVFTTIIIAFVATLTANGATATMVSFMDSEKYHRRKTIMMHVFLFNLALFIITIPIYIAASRMGIVNHVAAVHFLLSASISAIIMEIIAGEEYSLLGLYSTALGIFVVMGIALIMLASDGNQLLILFGAMPFTWFVLQITNALIELIYDNFFQYYGVAALKASTDIGGDAQAEAAEKEAEAGEGEEDDEDYEDEKEEV